jgi:dephospho-CoA kinase
MCILYQLKPNKLGDDILVGMNEKQVIIGITGTNGAGKGTVVEYLKTKGFRHYWVTGLITEEIIKRNMPVNRDSMILVGNEVRAERGAAYFVEELLKRAKVEGANSIIESIRTVGEAEVIKNNGGKLLAVDADRKTRYKRNVKRAGNKDDVTFEEFCEQERQEMNSEDPNKQNLAACRKMADFLIENNGTIEEFNEKIEELLNIIEKK